MITPKMGQLCEEAKLYYYDFLFLQDKDQIPEQVLSHIRQCRNCQKEIYELKTALTKSEFKINREYNHSGSPLANMLKLHFSYIDQDITCTIVKPFLPGLLDASMQISIPTPITTHLDHCPKCVQHLGKISDLNLSEVNLFRLSRFLAVNSDYDNINCSQAKSDIMAFVMMAFHESDEQTLKHLCICRDCRDAIYQYRETIRKEFLHEKAEKPCFLSERLTNNDIFDLVLPYELDLVKYRKSEFQQSRISHIRKCPFCLEKVQELHRTISDIAESTDSEIVTTFNVEESAKTVNAGNSEGLYAGFPIHVEVTGANEKTPTGHPGSIINFTSELKKKILTSNVKSFSKKGFVGLFTAAAILAAMFLYSPKAKALSLARFCNVLEAINNVHILLYTAGEENPTQEQWVSRSANIQIGKINDDLILRDINSNLQSTKKIGSEFTETTPIPEERLADFVKKIHGTLGLTPFYSISELPPDAEWKQLTTESQKINGEDEVYELTYVSNAVSDTELTKLRFTLNANTELPVRIDFYRKLSSESDFSPETWYIIEYISNEQFTAVQNSLFGN